jgi:antitoxin ParD1/3/4
VAAKSYTSTSEYLRQLIREHREVERFRTLIDEGAKAPIVGLADDAWFEGLRQRARNRGKR